MSEDEVVKALERIERKLEDLGDLIDSVAANNQDAIGDIRDDVRRLENLLRNIEADIRDPQGHK